MSTEIELQKKADELARASFNVVKTYESYYGKIEPVKVGDIYEFTVPTATRNEDVFKVGMTVTVLASTLEPAWGERSESGLNWLCKTDFGETIWTTLESCIARGLLRKVNQ